MENYQIESYSGAEMEALFDKINNLGNASQSADGLMSAGDKTKLDGLDSGAQANVLEGVKIAGADLPITEKKVNIPADSSPTSGSNSLVRSGGVFNAIKDFITRSVNDLVYYYTKSETYTKTEVNNIIGSLNQFHYEIYASTSAVTNPKSNVLYLIGPTGTGSDKYEEYVYSNGWVKIGDTTIDLSGYPTTEQMNAAINNALNDYATKEEVSQLGQEIGTEIITPYELIVSSSSQPIRVDFDMAKKGRFKLSFSGGSQSSFACKVALYKDSTAAGNLVWESGRFAFNKWVEYSGNEFDIAIFTVYGDMVVTAGEANIIVELGILSKISSLEERIDAGEKSDFALMVQTHGYVLSGGPVFDDNGLIIQSGVRWADGSAGTLRKTNFNENVLEYAVETVTHAASSKTVQYSYQFSELGEVTKETINMS